MLAVEHDVLVRFVGDHPEVVLARDRGQASQVLTGQDAAGRIARRIDIQDTRPRRDLRFELVEIVPPAVPLVQRHGHRNAFRRQDVADDRRPFGVGDQHLVARLEERVGEHVEPVDAAIAHQHVLGVVDRNAVLRLNGVGACKPVRLIFQMALLNSCEEQRCA